MYTLHKKAKKIGLHWWKSTVIRARTVCRLLIRHVKKTAKAAILRIEQRHIVSQISSPRLTRFAKSHRGVRQAR